MRTPVIAGNWKMNNTIRAGVRLAVELAALVRSVKNTEIIVCPPFIALGAVKLALECTNIKVGAQNIHWAENGAFTGEVAADMLKEIGVDCAIIGHSERRQYFGETDEMVNKRTAAALAAGIVPIVCCGESLDIREQGTTNEFIGRQVKAALEGLAPENVAGTIIAYEPIWAIGTGRTASSEQAQEACAFIRQVVQQQFDAETAEMVRILYGGSVKPSTIAELMSQPDLDGALVGGASLVAADFAKIVKFK